MAITSEYKYAHLLTKCECGNKFLMRNSSEIYKCDYCANPIGKCLSCRDVFVRTLHRDFCGDCYPQFTSTREICLSCGGSDLIPCGYLCAGCMDLDDRGNYTTNISVTGVPIGSEEGICVGCENKLFKVSGPNCFCHGCDIEPLYCSTVKPATSKRSSIS